MTKGYIIEDIVYDDKVNIYVYINYSEVESFKKNITDLTSGSAIIEYIDDEHISMKNGKRIK